MINLGRDIVTEIVMEKYGQKFTALVEKIRGRREKSYSSKSTISLSTYNLSSMISWNASQNYNQNQEAIYVDNLKYGTSKKSLNSENETKIILQVSKALYYCRNVKKMYLSDQHLFAEKLFITASLTKSLKQQQLLARPKFVGLKVGIVDISDITFLPKEVNKDKKYYLCTLSNESVVKATEIAELDQSGYVSFNEHFQFRNLPSEFEIKITLYELTEKKLKKDNFQMSRSVDYNFPFQGPLFQVNDEFTFTFQNVNRDPESPIILMKNLLKFSCKKSIQFEERLLCSGLLCVAKYAKFCPIWRLYFCKLEGNIFKYWHHPDQYSKPVKKVDLSCCKSLGIAEQEMTLMRGKCLFLELEEEFFLIRAATEEEFQKWYTCIGMVLVAAKDWA